MTVDNSQMPKKLNPHSHEMNIQKSVHFCDHPMMCQNVYDTRAQVFSTIQTFVLLGQSRQGLDWIVRPGYSFGVFLDVQDACFPIVYEHVHIHTCFTLPPTRVDLTGLQVSVFFSNFGRL